MAKTYQQLTEQVSKSRPVYSFIDKPTKLLLSNLEKNSSRLSQTKDVNQQMNILDEQMKIIAALVINKEPPFRKQ